MTHLPVNMWPLTITWRFLAGNSAHPFLQAVRFRWAILFCGWAQKVCRQYGFKTYLPVIVPFFGVNILAHKFCRQYSFKTCSRVTGPFFCGNFGPFCRQVSGPRFLQAARFKNVLTCYCAIFSGDLGPQFLQAVRFKNLLTCYCAIFLSGFGPTICAARFKNVLTCYCAFFSGDLGPQFLQAVRFKNLLTCYCAIFLSGFGLTICAGSTV